MFIESFKFFCSLVPQLYYIIMATILMIMDNYKTFGKNSQNFQKISKQTIYFIVIRNMAINVIQNMKKSFDCLTLTVYS